MKNPNSNFSAAETITWVSLMDCPDFKMSTAVECGRNRGMKQSKDKWLSLKLDVIFGIKGFIVAAFSQERNSREIIDAAKAI